MSSWHEAEIKEVVDSPDYARWFWAGVVGLIVLMLLALWIFRDDNAHFSQVQVRHILIPVSSADAAERQRALELATAIRQRIVDGEDFETLARQYSGDPGSASRGGYLGWSARGIYSEPFEEYVWAGEVGALSDLVITEHGFHIIQVLDRKLSEADAYDIEIDRKAWEQHRREEEERRKAGQQVAPALPNAPATTGAKPIAAPAVPSPVAPPVDVPDDTNGEAAPAPEAAPAQ